ncbi:WD40/YVTN/BNR-like repeat-containing protein [Pseudomonas sp. GCM10022186]|uniref:WD40/YVTN/BNR-like repeat-containing protein n=1 Tax=Pseudomonas sp. GCM10022186 TaxID=3252650 RepID=UPI00360A8D61
MKTVNFTALALLFGLGVNLQAAPLGDRLERASHLSPFAIHAPLTDVQSIRGRLVMVGESGHILLRDTDGNIKQSEVPVDLLLTAVHFVDEINGWAVGHDGVVLRSADGGKTWNKQLDGRHISQLMLDWAKADVARREKENAGAPGDEEISTALDNALFALDDAEAGRASGPSRPLLDVWFRDAQEGWAVGAYGMIVHTSNGGQSWEFVSDLANPDRLHLNAVLGLVDGGLLVAGEGGRLYSSSDGGRHWEVSQQLTQASIYRLMQLKDGQVLALGFGGALLSSVDGGRNWKTIALPVPVSIYGGEQLSDGSLVLAGQGGMLLYSGDGQQFETINNGHTDSLLGVAQLSPEVLALVGSSGLQLLPVAELKERL